MKKIFLVVPITFITVLLAAQETTEGIWSTGEENTQIETYQKDGAWFGKITSSDHPKAKTGMGTPDQLEGIKAFLEKRKSRFYEK